MTDHLFIANGGIGYELARQLLANANKYVLLGSRSLQKGESAVAELKFQHLNGTVELIQVDVTSEKSVAAAAKQVENKYGRNVPLFFIWAGLPWGPCNMS